MDGKERRGMREGKGNQMEDRRWGGMKGEMHASVDGLSSAAYLRKVVAECKE